MNRKILANELVKIAKQLVAEEIKVMDVVARDTMHYTITLSNGRTIYAEEMDYNYFFIESKDSSMARVEGEVAFKGTPSSIELKAMSKQDRMNLMIKKFKEVPSEFWTKFNDRISKELNTPDEDKAFLKVLTDLFTASVGMEDVRYIRYRLYKSYLRLLDADNRMGHMDASTSNKDIDSRLRKYGKTVKDLIQFLEKNGAKTLKQQQKPKYYAPIYD